MEPGQLPRGKRWSERAAVKDQERKRLERRGLSKVSLGWLKKRDLYFPDGLHGEVVGDNLRRDDFFFSESTSVSFHVFIISYTFTWLKKSNYRKRC